MPQNPLQAYSATAQGPALDFVPIGPANADLATPIRALRVNGAGSLRLTGLGGGVVDMDVVAGEVVGGWITRVHLIGTTATGLVGYL